MIQEKERREFGVPKEEQRRIKWKLPAQLGETSMIVGTWGMPVSVAESGTGFGMSHQFDDTVDVRDEEAQHWHAQYAAEFTKDVLRTQDKDGAEILIFTSITSYPSTADEYGQILKKEGIGFDQLFFADQACIVAQQQLVDKVIEYEGKDIDFVIAGTDSMSGKAVSKRNPQMSNYFGNGGGAILFSPKNWEYLCGETLVFHDKDHVFTAPQMFPWPPSEVPSRPAPSWYTIEEGAEDMLYISENMIVLNIPVSIDNLVDMHGSGTAKLFLYRTPRLIVKWIRTYRRELEQIYGPLQKPCFHQAGQDMKEGVEGITLRFDIEGHLVDIGKDEKEAKKESMKLYREWGEKTRLDILRDAGLPEYLGIDLPWDINDPIIQVNNNSGFTAVAQLTKSVAEGSITPGKPLPIIGKAIGGMTCFHVAIPH